MAKNNRPIGIDFDDVVANFSDALREFHNARYGTNIVREEHYTFNLEVLWGCTMEQMIERVDEFYHSPEHEVLLPIEGAVEGLKELGARHTLAMITSRPAYVRGYTLDWISRYIPDVFSEMHFLGHYTGGTHPRKSKGDVCRDISARLLIDDALHNAVSVAAEGIPVLLLDAPWNQGKLPPLVTRVSGWDEVRKILR